MSYSDKFSSGDFVDKIQRIAKRAGSKLVYGSLLLYYTMQSDKVSRKDKAIIIGALGYLISPLDVMPDAIPIVGLADDMAVLVYVLKKVWSLVSDEARQKAKDKMHLWFDDDEMNDVDSIINDNEQYTEG
jgi:uncharacterized membrane protein YkvA (DUF1232 family)